MNPIIPVPWWFLFVPVLTGLIPTLYLVVIISGKSKRELKAGVREEGIPSWILTLPFTNFIIPMFLLAYFLIFGYLIPFYYVVIPVVTFFLPMYFLTLHWYDLKRYAPEAIVWKKVRKMIEKGIKATVVRIVHGNDMVDMGWAEPGKDNHVIVQTKKFGYKINAQAYENIPHEHTRDGVPIMNCSSVGIVSVSGTGAWITSEVIRRVREGYKKLNHLSDLQLTTLLTKEGDELKADAHHFLDRLKEGLGKDDDNPGKTSGVKSNIEDDDELDNELYITENELVDTVIEIQREYGHEKIEIPPKSFYLYRTLLSVVNCAYTGAFLKDFELITKQIALTKAEKFGYEKLLILAFAFTMVVIGGAVGIFILSQVFLK